MDVCSGTRHRPAAARARRCSVPQTAASLLCRLCPSRSLKCQSTAWTSVLLMSSVTQTSGWSRTSTYAPSLTLLKCLFEDEVLTTAQARCAKSVTVVVNCVLRWCLQGSAVICRLGATGQRALHTPSPGTVEEAVGAASSWFVPPAANCIRLITPWYVPCACGYQMCAPALLCAVFGLAYISRLTRSLDASIVGWQLAERGCYCW